MKKIFLTLGLISIYILIGYTQSDIYLDGYVIKESGDTIFGKLKFLTGERSCFEIRFIDDNSERIRFKIKDTRAYKRGDEFYIKKIYKRPLTIFNQGCYMKVLVDGDVKLYRFNYEINTPSGMGLNGEWLPGGSGFCEDYYIEKDGELLLVDRDEFKDTVSEIFADYYELSEQIKSQSFTYREIVYIVEVYNNKKSNTVHTDLPQ